MERYPMILTVYAAPTGPPSFNWAELVLTLTRAGYRVQEDEEHLERIGRHSGDRFDLIDPRGELVGFAEPLE